MSRSAYSRCCRTSYPPPLGYLYAFHPATSANAATSAAATTLGGKLEQELAIAAHGDGAVGFALHPVAAASSHRLQVVLPVVRISDRSREQLWSARGHDDPAADPLDNLGRLAVRLRSDDHRPRDRQNPVQPTRDDVAGETRSEPDDVHVRRRE